MTAQQSRRLWRIVGAALVVGLCLLVLFLVAPPDEVIAQLRDMSPAWLLAALLLELGSCLSYPIVFRRFFPEPTRAATRRVSWVAMGVGAVLPGGNISSAAAAGWLMRRHGVGRRTLAERCSAMLCLLTLFGFAVNGVAALLLLVRVPDGPHDILHTGGPIVVSVAVLGTAVLLMFAARRLGPRAPLPLRGLGVALEGAWAQARSGHWRLLGAAGFLCLDMGALWAACAATGHRPGLLAVLIAYCIGYLATLAPIPAGLGVLDSGLAGALVLYGMPPAASISAVLVYHAISIWVPGVGGLIASVAIRRRHRPEPEGEVSLPAVTSRPALVHTSSGCGVASRSSLPSAARSGGSSRRRIPSGVP